MIRYLLPLALTASTIALPAHAASSSDAWAAQEGRRRQLVVGALKDDARRNQAVAQIEISSRAGQLTA